MTDEEFSVWEPVSMTDPRVESALEELRALIRWHYPNALFAVERGEEPDGLWLTATVDIEDPDEVFDLVVDRLLEMQIEERLPVHVLPLRTPERIAIMSAEGKFGPRYATTLTPRSLE